MENDRVRTSMDRNSTQDISRDTDVLEDNSVSEERTIHIKTLEELNEDMSKYKGMILSFRKDGVIPPPMKSVEEMHQIHEKAPIYYGRSGEKYGKDTVLTGEALQNDEIRIDRNGKTPQEETVRTKETPLSDIGVQSGFEQEKAKEDSVNFSVNGLNMEYLQSLLEEEKSENVSTFSDADTFSSTDTFSSADTFSGDDMFSSTDTFSGTSAFSNATVNANVNSSISEASTPANTNMRMSRAAYIKKMSQNPPVKTEDTSPVILKERDTITPYKVVKEMLTYSICLVIAIVLSFLLVIFVVQKTEVIGDSMNPTLQNEQQLVIDKISYRFREPKRFEIVVFPQGESKYIKRIIGLPGETVSIEEGYIYINGELLSDDVYGSEPISADNYYRLASPVTLGEGEYFVMGDNRNNSSDSRDTEVGNVPKEKFIGRAVWRIWPIKEMRILK